MTFKEFMSAIAYLPATIFSGTINLVLGSTKKDTRGKVELDKEQHAKVNPSLLGLVLDSVAYIGRAIGDFITNHRKAIATAFWSSLVLGGAAALAVFLSPAALAAVTTFSVYGLSIAGVVGANTALQIGAVATLAFAATSIATYLAATVVNTISAIIDCFKRPSTSTTSEESSNEDDFTNGSANAMNKLSSQGGPSKGVVIEKDPEPVHATVFQKDASHHSHEEEEVLTEGLACKA